MLDKLVEANVSARCALLKIKTRIQKYSIVELTAALDAIIDHEETSLYEVAGSMLLMFELTLELMKRHGGKLIDLDTELEQAKKFKKKLQEHYAIATNDELMELLQHATPVIYQEHGRAFLTLLVGDILKKRESAEKN